MKAKKVSLLSITAVSFLIAFAALLGGCEDQQSTEMKTTSVNSGSPLTNNANGVDNSTSNANSTNNTANSNAVTPK